MNLSKLFKKQKKLDDHIIAEKGLQGLDLLDKKILALLTELGELANEWRGFKFWSEDQESRVATSCWNCSGFGNGYFSGIEHTGKKERCIECNGDGLNFNENPLLEEYVDCLHFILSIGNDLNIEGIMPRKIYRTDITFVLNEMFEVIGKLRNIHVRNNEYQWLINEFINLGEMLSFTWEQIEQAYYDKNKINHERQESGY